MNFDEFMNEITIETNSFNNIDELILESTNVESDICDFVKRSNNVENISNILLQYNDKYHILENMFQMESTLSKKERDALSDEDFGIPSKREFPIHDINHIKSAIRFFKHCAEEDRNTLANNIKKAIEKNGLELSHFKNSKFLNYVTESVILESLIPKWELIENKKLFNDDGLVKIALELVNDKKIPNVNDFIAAISGKYNKHSINLCIRAIKQCGNGYLIPDFQDNMASIPKHVLWFSLTPIYSVDRVKSLLQLCDNDLSKMLLVLMILGEGVNLNSKNNNPDMEMFKKQVIEAYKEHIQSEIEFLNREPMLEPIDYIMMESICSNMYDTKYVSILDNDALKLFSTFFTEESLTELLPKSEKIPKEITPILNVPNKHITVDNYYIYMENNELFCTGLTDDIYWTVQLTNEKTPLLECQLHCTFLDQKLSHSRISDTVSEKNKIYNINDIGCALESVIGIMELSFDNNDTDGILESYDSIRTIRNQLDYMAKGDSDIKYTNMYFTVLQKERYLSNYIKNHNLK